MATREYEKTFRRRNEQTDPRQRMVQKQARQYTQAGKIEVPNHSLFRTGALEFRWQAQGPRVTNTLASLSTRGSRRQMEFGHYQRAARHAYRTK
jgi:hypothetical protein